MGDMKTEKNRESRRRLLKTITYTGGAAATLKGLPDTWTLPVVDTVMLPAHAQTSPGGFQATCMIPFSNTFQASSSGTSIAGTYTGTQAALGSSSNPITGDCNSAGFFFEELPLTITITSEGGDLFRVNYNLTTASFSFEFVTTIVEQSTGFMGSNTFSHTLVESNGFTIGGSPAQLETTYEIVIPATQANLSIAGEIVGVAWVNEAVGP